MPRASIYWKGLVNCHYEIVLLTMNIFWQDGKLLFDNSTSYKWVWHSLFEWEHYMVCS